MRLEELKNKGSQPTEEILIPYKGISRPSKKIRGNHTVHPILEGGEYTLIREGRDFYNVKCNGKSIYVQKWIFDDAPKRIPRWIIEAREEFDKTYEYE